VEVVSSKSQADREQWKDEALVMIVLLMHKKVGDILKEKRAEGPPSRSVGAVALHGNQKRRREPPFLISD